MAVRYRIKTEDQPEFYHKLQELKISWRNIVEEPRLYFRCAIFRGDAILVINTGTVLALRCPHCGKFYFHAISLFLFSGKPKISLACECEKSTVTIAMSKYRNFVIRTFCSMCEADHAYVFKYRELFSSKVMSLNCLETGLEIGFIGPKEQVVAAINQLELSFDLFEEELARGFFLESGEIMHQVVEYLNRLSEEGTLKCKCGCKNIDLDLLPDRLEMICSECGNKGLIFAESKEDFLTLKGWGKIELSEQEITIKTIPSSFSHNGQ